MRFEWMLSVDLYDEINSEFRWFIILQSSPYVIFYTTKFVDYTLQSIEQLLFMSVILLAKKLNIVVVQIYYLYPSFSIAFSCIWSICSWEISSDKLHQSLPLIIKLNVWSSGCTHLPFVKMSAFIGSEGENHLHDRQFSDCHDILFKLFVASVIFNHLLTSKSKS